jgi:hypothetical protein
MVMSFILTRTPRGEELVRSAMANRRLHAQPARIDELTAIQPGQYSKAVVAPLGCGRFVCSAARLRDFEGSAVFDVSAVPACGPLVDNSSAP